MNTRRIAERAEYWFARLESGNASAQEQEQFIAWLNADNRHYIAYCQVEKLSAAVEEMTQLIALQPLESNQSSISPNKALHASLPASIKHTEKKAGISAPFAGLTWGSGAVLAAMLVIALLLPFMLTPDDKPVSYTTRVAEISEVILDDGSVVDLGARSQLSVQYSNNTRHVEIMGGEAFFSVVSDQDRPFIVQAGDTQIRVTGTRFNVRTDPWQISVAVAEGTVNVSKPRQSWLPLLGEWWPEQRRLQAGQKVVASRAESNHALQDVATVTSSEPGSWRYGSLIYDNASLREVISDANRYSSDDIIIADSELAELRVTAAFGSDQIDAMLDGLAFMLPVQVDRTVPGRTLIKSR